MKTNFVKDIALQLQLKLHAVENTLNLLENDATIPFIARYRKDQTGGLDELQIQAIQELWQQLIVLEKRKAFILKTIEELNL